MARKQPIILIPGIQGTKLVNINDKDFDTVWSGVKKYYANIHKLELHIDGLTDIGAENIVERADVENIAYSEIINYLRSIGYRVFIFGYDWRKSNMVNAEDLLDFVLMIQRKLRPKAINFLTHSMGSLVLSGFLKIYNASPLKDIVNKIIFTVPPFLGSVEASFNLTIGKSRFLNSSDDFRKIGRTFPGLYELLPVYNSAYEFEDANQQNNYSFYDFSSYWQQVGHVNNPKTQKKHELITKRLKELGDARNQNNFIFDLSQLPSELRSRCLVLAGGGELTKEKIYVQKVKDHYINYFDYEHFNDSIDGDGTVPIPSSTAFKKDILTLKIATSSLEKRLDGRLIMSDWHAFFLNNGRVQNILKRFFDTPKGDLQPDWFRSGGGKEIINCSITND